MKRSFDEAGGDAAAPESKRQEPPGPPETVLRLLVPVRRVGAIIGKHGIVIKEVSGISMAAGGVHRHWQAGAAVANACRWT